MTTQQLNRWSALAVLALSFAAALLVVVGASVTILSGGRPGPPHDEGAAAHVFQLLIAALVPATVVFLATAEWQAPVRVARALALAGAFLVVAFGVLYYFEKILGY